MLHFFLFFFSALCGANAKKFIFLLKCNRINLNKRKSSSAAAAQLLQSCPTLCNPMECSPPGSSVHGILQARRLEWVALPCSRGSSRPASPALWADSLLLNHEEAQNA